MALDHDIVKRVRPNSTNDVEILRIRMKVITEITKAEMKDNRTASFLSVMLPFGTNVTMIVFKPSKETNEATVAIEM